ncbi:MAG: hypothetical protein ACQESF_01105 [Nanobdellota archaeon]
MKLRAQVSFFLIIGIIIIIVVSATFFFFESISSSPSEDGSRQAAILAEEQKLRTYLQSCMHETLVDGVKLLSIQGGCIYKCNLSLDSEMGVRYHWIENQNVSPDVVSMEDELSRYVQENIPGCIDGINSTMLTAEGKPSAEVDILADKIVFNLFYPLRLDYNTSVKHIKEFSSSSDLPLFDILRLKTDLLKNDQDIFFIRDLLAKHSRISLLVLPYDSSSIVYTFLYNGTDNLVFNAAVKNIDNMPPTLMFIPDFVMNKKEEFKYNLNASDPDNDTLRYYSSAPLININQTTGQIKFTPVVKGEYEVEVCVEDSYGLSDCRNITFMIK